MELSVQEYQYLVSEITRETGAKRDGSGKNLIVPRCPFCGKSGGKFGIYIGKATAHRRPFMAHCFSCGASTRTLEQLLAAIGRMDLASLGINGVLLVLIPVLVTELCAIRVERAQPRNLFVYIFFCGFFPAALATLMTLLGGLALLWMDGLFPMPPWLDDFAGYLWLVAFPEAFINGTIVTALVVFYPDWLETFSRSRYLQAPWKEGDHGE